MYMGFVRLSIHRKSLLSNYSVPNTSPGSEDTTIIREQSRCPNRAYVLVKEADSQRIKESVCNSVSGYGLNSRARRWLGGGTGKARQGRANVLV